MKIKFMLRNLLIIIILCMVCVNFVAADVGQQLTQPEAGWKRINNTDANISYSSNFGNLTNVGSNNSTYFQDDRHSTGANDQTIRFNFTGDKIRIISALSPDAKNNIKINIDGISYTMNQNGSTKCHVVLFEKLDLANGEHYFELNTGTESGKVYFDAIDIDDTKELKPFNTLVPPNNISVVAENKQVVLKWDSVEAATSYRVKRSRAAGGPYDDKVYPISSGVTCIDIDVTNDTTYYYVVTAVNSTGESGNSNEVSATPKAGTVDPQPTGDRAILEIAMTNNTVKEYDLSTTEVNAFLKWYEDRANDSGKAYYAVPKNHNVKPFTSRTEYISFDKIYSFEVKAYKN